MNTHKAGPYGGPITHNYPRDQWWVAATSDEVTRMPMQRWILDYPVVLYRKEHGGIVALDDRCPHRWAPLSKGWLEGDNIVCGYHGFRYGPTGRCVKVPTQAAAPAKAFVRSYPILERDPLVWIWTGDPQHAQSALPPDIPWLHDGKWRGTRGYMDIAANYMLLKENVLDLTHFGYVHRTTFKILDWDRSPDVKVEDNQVEFTLAFPPRPLAPIFAEMTGFGTRPIARVNWGRYLSPALQHAGQDFTDPEPVPGSRDKASFRVLHATTPVNPSRMHYFWFFAFDLPLSEAQIEKVRALTMVGFAEDDAMISAVQQMMELDPRGTDYPEIMIATDRSAVEARRALARQLGRTSPAQKLEQPGDP
ncbi:MAG TPA: aromatic ring-hydroxylating dioxygenase subunit alpha [Steroidobacteraceae bacterium]|nr:aromatic ring-hydroxylating dioxygenase subunit alpha [Steroidobacteraceae bacterium]